MLIDSEAALGRALVELTRLDPAMAGLVEAGIRPPLRLREPGFPGLAAIIVSQQVSTASAAAIWARVQADFVPLTPEAILSADEEALRRPGLSGPKIRTLRAVAAAAMSGVLPLDRLGDMEADEAHARLTAVSGIGPWSADIYLMFCLGHGDAFAAGDLALQEAARLVLMLDGRPDAKALAGIAERWRPWRAVAARMLWAHYRVAKSRDGVPAG